MGYAEQPLVRALRLPVPAHEILPVTSLFAHVVWATAHRTPAMPLSVDKRLAEVLSEAAEQCDSAVLAAGNGIDHVHVLVRHSPALSLGDLVARLKRAASNDSKIFRRTMMGLDWDRAYWAESIGADDIAYVAMSIRAQRRHHEAGLPEAWEDRWGE